MYEVMTATAPATIAAERIATRIVARSRPTSVTTKTTPSVIAAMYAYRRCERASALNVRIASACPRPRRMSEWNDATARKLRCTAQSCVYMPKPRQT